jgi:hypothetical protein
MEFSRCARAELAQREFAGRCFQTALAGLSKLNSERDLCASKDTVEVDVDLGEPDHGRITINPSTSLAATSSNCYWDP